MAWLEVVVETTPEQAEQVADLLRSFSPEGGVALEQWGDPENLDPAALVPVVQVKVFIPQRQDSPEVRQLIAARVTILDPGLKPTFRQLADTNWADNWRAHYRPLRIGKRLLIQPGWLPLPPSGADRVALVLDPGMAFGTGLHATTQLCLELVEALAKPGGRVLDLGTGSGILALAAAALGAGPVVAVDNDPVAASVARSNVRLNRLTDRVQVVVGELPAVAGVWDLIAVNILAPVIEDLLRTRALLDTLAPGGRIILSGLIVSQEALVLAALHDAGGALIDRYERDDWLAMVAGRR